VPADLYKTGILVEVHGVRVLLNADFEDQELASGIQPKEGRSEKRSKGVKADKPRSNQSQVHDPGGLATHDSSRTTYKDGDISAGNLPTTVDLAQSFLQAEPKKEKAELQASVPGFESLDQSLMSEDGEIGVGNNFSLPIFLADFLKGVGDRIELKIQDVEVDLILRLDRPSDTSSSSDSSDRPEHVSLRLAIEGIRIDGTIAHEQAIKWPDGQKAPSLFTQECRRVTLSNVDAMVISEASFFADIARSTAPSSPETTHASSIAKAGSRDRPASNSNHGSDHGSINSGLAVSLDMENLPGVGSEDTSGRNAWSPAPDFIKDEERQASSQQFPYNQSQHHDRLYADSLFSSMELNQNVPEPLVESGTQSPSLLHNDTTSHLDRSPSPRHRYHQRGVRHSPSEVESSSTIDDSASALIPDRTIESHQISSLQTKQGLSNQPTKIGLVDEASNHSLLASDRSSPDSGDLAESKLFTHEEASMYMSAVSQTFHGEGNRDISIPGDWDSSGSGHGEECISSNAIEESSNLLRHDDERSCRSHGSNDELDPRPSDKISSDRSPRVSRAQSTRDNAASTIIETDTEAFSTPSKEANNFSRGSETSSANSKSSFTVYKRIISIDLIVAELPLGSQSRKLPPETRGPAPNRIGQDMPGGFEQVPGAYVADPPFKASKLAQAKDDYLDVTSCSIDIEEIQFLGDMGLTKMMILIIQRWNSSRRPLTTKVDKHEGPVSNQKMDLRLSVKKANWKFLDTVKGTPLLKIQNDSPRTGIGLFPGDSEVLLRANIEDLHVEHSKIGASSITKFSTGKFNFGYSSSDILSFDPDLKMRESTRDILAPVGSDVVLTITNSRDMLKVDLTTLPLHVALDLRRLDETFSWFGGFSSMLGLGSSMMSTMTIVDKNPKAARSKKFTRGVHFESPKPSRSTPHGSSNIQKKVTARIGGLVFELQGTQSSLRLESTAMKIVSRAEGLGLQVDRLKFGGPYLKQDVREPSTSVQLVNLRVEYLSMPKENDLTRLLALLSPSKDKDARDDGILLETLLRQRRQGAVVRATVESLEGNISNLNDLRCFPLLAEDLKKLSSVTKYLPEDERAGILALMLIKEFRLAVMMNSNFGIASLVCKNVEGAHVTFPTLVALAIDTVQLHRNGTEELMGAALPLEVTTEYNHPTIMVRFIGNEMEPAAKIKIRNLRLEYHVSTVMAIMGLDDSSGTEAILNEMISSITTITDQRPSYSAPPKLSNQSSTSSENPASSLGTVKLDIDLRNSIIGLNPRQSSAKALLIFTDTYLVVSRPRTEQVNAALEIKKASIMVVDDVQNITPLAVNSTRGKPVDGRKSQIESLSDVGYVTVGLISAAKATVEVVDVWANHNKAVDVEIRDDLFILETCADSTQTLLSILNGLKPPMPPSTELKYMTEVVPIEDMLASFTGDAFVTTTNDSEDEDPPLELDEGDMMDDEVPQNLEFVSSFYNPKPDAAYDGIADSMLEDQLESIATPSGVRKIGDKNLLESFQDQAQVAPGNIPLVFHEDHFGDSSVVGRPSDKWNTKQKSRGSITDHHLHDSPLRIRVRDVHIIWNLFDGYDWQHTRDAISQAVEEVQSKATERLGRQNKRRSFDLEEEEESVIGDFLFNSIYIGIPANRDPRELTRQVNRNIDDLVSDSESYATSSSSGSPNRQGQIPRQKDKKLRLKRSRSHKMTFELKGVSANVVVLPPGLGETQSLMDIRIQDMEIFDHVPTSTWKKFATYMHDAGERQSGTSMIHLEISNVKPVPHLAASEIILKVRSIPQFRA